MTIPPLTDLLPAFLDHTRPAPAWATEGRHFEIEDRTAAREPSSMMFTEVSHVDVHTATALVDVHSSETWAGQSLVPAVRLEVLGGGGMPRFNAASARAIAQALTDAADLLDQINSQD